MGKKIELVNSSRIKSVCAEALGVNRKNIYRKLIRPQKDENLKDQINKVHDRHPEYGHRRVAWHLKLNHKRIIRVMNKFGIKSPRRKVKNHYCTRSVSNCPYTNLIKDLIPAELIPHQLWCSDTTPIKFHGRFWYLTTIEDIATRQIVAVQLGRHHDRYLILTALKQALLTTGKLPQIFHSDQGSEFMAEACTEFLENKGIKISVSDKASPWQNGFKESFFGRFKDEFGDFNRFEGSGQFLEAIYTRINYYNRERIHSAFRMPPAVYAAKASDNCLTKRGT